MVLSVFIGIKQCIKSKSNVVLKSALLCVFFVCGNRKKISSQPNIDYYAEKRSNPRGNPDPLECVIFLIGSLDFVGGIKHRV